MSKRNKNLSKSARYFWKVGSLWRVNGNVVSSLDIDRWVWEKSNLSKEAAMSGREASKKDLLPILNFAREAEERK